MHVHVQCNYVLYVIIQLYYTAVQYGEMFNVIMCCILYYTVVQYGERRASTNGVSTYEVLKCIMHENVQYIYMLCI